jgi:hypothetical protein
MLANVIVVDFASTRWPSATQSRMSGAVNRDAALGRADGLADGQGIRHC